MPLKEADLKTLEVYKHAIQQDVSRITATGETKFWIYRNIELPDKKKNPVLLVLVDDAGVRNFFHSKRPVCSGMCHLVGSEVAFGPKVGKVPYKLLRTAVPLFLAKKLYIPPNINPDEEPGESDDGAQESPGAEATAAAPHAQATAPAPPHPSPAPNANLMAEWPKLAADTHAAMAVHPERKDVLARAAASIVALLKAGQFAEAKPKMDLLRGMLNAPSPPPPVPNANLMAEWHKLSEDARSVITAHPERKEALTQAAAGIPELIKANREADARQKMQQVQALLDAPPHAAPSATELTARWNALIGRMRAAAAGHPEKKADLVKAGTGIPEMIKAGNLDAARKAMDVVEGVLSALAQPAGVTPEEPLKKGREAAGETAPLYTGIVEYRRALLEFDKARTAVDAQIESLRKAIPAANPEETEVAEAIADIMTEWNDELTDAVDEALNTAEDQDSPVTDAIRSSLDHYLASLDSHELIQLLDANPLVPVSIAATLRPALLRIKSAMPVPAK